jgi:cytochrome c peroxidase
MFNLHHKARAARAAHAHRSPRALVALGLAATVLAAAAATSAEMLSAYAAQAGGAGQAARGQSFFTSTHGKEWSCSSCHTPSPTGAGKHASTGKPIQPLAPAANPQRFTDTAKTEKWFRRNCGDVLGRECSAQEKADVLAWLQAQK